MYSKKSTFFRSLTRYDLSILWHVLWHVRSSNQKYSSHICFSTYVANHMIFKSADSPMCPQQSWCITAKHPSIEEMYHVRVITITVYRGPQILDDCNVLSTLIAYVKIRYHETLFVKYEHLTKIVCILTGVIVSSSLVKSSFCRTGNHHYCSLLHDILT